MQAQRPIPDAMLNMDQVRKLVPLSHCQIYRLMKTGEFPRQVKIGKRRVAWRTSEIVEWIDRRPFSTA